MCATSFGVCFLCPPLDGVGVSVVVSRHLATIFPTNCSLEPSLVHPNPPPQLCLYIVRDSHANQCVPIHPRGVDRRPSSMSRSDLDDDDSVDRVQVQLDGGGGGSPTGGGTQRKEFTLPSTKQFPSTEEESFYRESEIYDSLMLRHPVSLILIYGHVLSRKNWSKVNKHIR